VYIFKKRIKINITFFFSNFVRSHVLCELNGRNEENLLSVDETLDKFVERKGKFWKKKKR